MKSIFLQPLEFSLLLRSRHSPRIVSFRTLKYQGRSYHSNQFALKSATNRLVTDSNQRRQFSRDERTNDNIEDIPYTRAKAAIGASTTSVTERRRLIVEKVSKLYNAGEKIAMTTVWDLPSAMHSFQAGVDLMLVGDSLAMTILGYESTADLSLHEMVHHCRAARRGAPDGLIIGDLTCGSYELSTNQAVASAKRLVEDGHVDAVKLEGGEEREAAIAAIVSAGIPVIGHVGLTPQRKDELGGYKVQASELQSALKLYDNLMAVQRAGAFATVIECCPARIVELLLPKLKIPVIGIGAGSKTAGQVLVSGDLLDLTCGPKPRFCRQFADMGSKMASGFQSYVASVKSGEFPAEEHNYKVKKAILEEFKRILPGEKGSLKSR